MVLFVLNELLFAVGLSFVFSLSPCLSRVKDVLDFQTSRGALNKRFRYTSVLLVREREIVKTIEPRGIMN